MSGPWGAREFAFVCAQSGWVRVMLNSRQERGSHGCKNVLGNAYFPCARHSPSVVRDISACLRSLIFPFSWNSVGISLYIFFIPTKAWVAQRGANSKVNLFLPRRSAEEWPGILGALAKVPGAFPTPAPPPDPRNPGLFLDCVAKTRDVAISRRSFQHALSVAAGTDDQIRTGVNDPKRLHWYSVGAIGIISAQLFRRIGDCMLPLNVGHAAATQLFKMQIFASCRGI